MSEPRIDLAFIRERLPERSDKAAYLVHALRFFEDVLAYAERLEADRASLSHAAPSEPGEESTAPSMSDPGSLDAGASHSQKESS